MGQIRFVTAASLFDGHDVSINIMRRILQSKGIEVIHLGHNRSAQEVVDAAIQEDANAVALSSYQGGHNEYFAYIRELLDKRGGKEIKIFGGGGGVITPKEIEALHSKGITRIYSPGDGMKLGIDGIVDDMIEKSKRSHNSVVKEITPSLTDLEISKIITHIEDHGSLPLNIDPKTIPVLGITGTGGAGKSSLIDELMLRFHTHYPDYRIALISVDPTRKKTHGALLGDRIRLGTASYPNFYVRSLATRDSKNELSPQIKSVTEFLKSLNFDLIIIETSGIGQSSDEITQVADKCIYVMTPEYGAQTQLEKIEMLDSADIIVLNKFEKPRSEDAFRDIKKQYRRNKQLFEGHPGSPTDEELPIFATMASQFNDVGVNRLFHKITKTFNFKEVDTENLILDQSFERKNSIIPPERSLYLREISHTVKEYMQKVTERSELIYDYESLIRANEIVKSDSLSEKISSLKDCLKDELEVLSEIDRNISNIDSGEFSYSVRGKEIKVKTKFESLSGNSIPRVAFPRFKSLAEKYIFTAKFNLPGFFPYSAGVFPFKRADEDPKRMFAGEGGPERTNKRFHYLSDGEKAKRLSTAFDSVTLYGEDPDFRPDIFGKIGEAGVSIATLEDMKSLFEGFDLTSPFTSVSMTINGPAPIILAMYMRNAINQKTENKENLSHDEMISVLQQVRGTVQADILKEDQAQNTCIFSLGFSLKMMGDIQEFFCKNQIKNYYSVSISGYHIAEAGANPITQLAFTLANGFTYVEYYLSRGMNIDEICPNLSFFFSNGLDPEYTVLGTVARRIWAISMRDKYGANEKSQKFKYHIQTSGRSLHAQEIDFNDIRTTLQAFIALSDNCNSLHTNAYDEAITTPTEESVRRAMAIQMIINREFGMNKTDNPLQGSYLFNELCDIVESQVLKQFEIISDKGGVLGAMEVQYQRSQIQEESLYYERLKDSGEMPIIGVNTFIAPNIEEQLNKEIELSRCSDDEKNQQIARLHKFWEQNKPKSQEALNRLRKVALSNGNIFEELLYTVQYCSLGQITSVLYQIGGKYRRNV